MFEDTRHVVGHRAHDETVEQRHVSAGAGTRDNTAGGQELEILQRFIKPLFPGGLIGFRLGQRVGDSPPAILDRLVDDLTTRFLVPVLHIPDLLGDCGDGGHPKYSLSGLRGSEILW